MSKSSYTLQWDCPACGRPNLVNQTSHKNKGRIEYICLDCNTLFYPVRYAVKSGNPFQVKRYQVPAFQCCGHPVNENGLVCCGDYQERFIPYKK